jgi:predicted RNA-binding Zn-ribbon protein involved in translation (DUF1610 family)
MSLRLGETLLEEFDASLKESPIFSWAKQGKESSFVHPLDLRNAQEEIQKIGTLLNDLTALVRSPHLLSKREEVILRQEESGALTPENIRESIHDTPLWRKKRGSYSPEYVHSSYNEDEVVTYENRLVCTLIGKLKGDLDELSRITEPLEKTLFRTLEGVRPNYGPFGLYERLSGEDENILLTPDSGVDPSFFSDEVKRLRSRIHRLSNTPFYLTVSPHPFVGTLLPTNVLLHDPLYNAAYRYYRLHYLQANEASNIDLLYRNYALLRILSSFVNQEKKKPALHYEKDRIHFEDFSLERKPFELKFHENQDDLIIETTLSPKDPVFTHVLHFAYLSAPKSGHPFLVEGNPLEEEIQVNAFSSGENPEGTLTLSPFSSAQKNLKNLASSLTLTLPLSKGFSQERCPVCGENKLAREEKAFRCPSCHSSFAWIEENAHPYLWLGIVGRGK